MTKTLSVIARLAASAVLLWALAPHPYSYYQLLRVLVCGVSAYTAWLSVEVAERRPWGGSFAAIALLVSPLLPVHLIRSSWAPVDVGVAVAFVASLYFVRPREIARLAAGEQKKLLIDYRPPRGGKLQ
jgi:hypothetical protein